MNNLVNITGEFVLTILILIIPMLTAFSFCLNWLDGIKLIFVVLMALEFILVITMIDKIIVKSTS